MVFDSLPKINPIYPKPNQWITPFEARHGIESATYQQAINYCKRLNQAFNPNYSRKLQESIHIIFKKQYLVRDKVFLKFEESKKSCEMLPCSALKLEMLNQCTLVRFMRISNFALITTKFLGE